MGLGREAPAAAAEKAGSVLGTVPETLALYPSQPSAYFAERNECKFALGVFSLLLFDVPKLE